MGYNYINTCNICHTHTHIPMQTFISCLKSQQQSTQSQQTITNNELSQQIDQMKQLVRKSFLQNSSPASSSSSSLASNSAIASSSASLSPREEFNFECYSHFRVYNDILVKQKVFFPLFQKEFESIVGKRLLQLTYYYNDLHQPPLTTTSSSSSSLKDCLRTAFHTSDAIAILLKSKGIISSWERTNPSEEDIDDWSSSSSSPSAENFYATSDLQYTLALNGDVTLNSQLLLQELGYRMYPSFGRWMVQEGLRRCFLLRNDDTNSSNSSKSRDGAVNGNIIVGKVNVNIDDYYFDTAYNSNPDLFEVKQVLLNIVIQRG